MGKPIFTFDTNKNYLSTAGVAPNITFGGRIQEALYKIPIMASSTMVLYVICPTWATGGHLQWAGVVSAKFQSGLRLSNSPFTYTHPPPPKERATKTQLTLKTIYNS